MQFKILVSFVGLLAIGAIGCARDAQSVRIEHARVEADPSQKYADALAEAFERYDAEIRVAADPIYASEAEAEAVSRTLAPVRFDQHLSVALDKRGICEADLRRFAMTHPRFVEEQAALYEGRMAALERAAQDVSLRAELTMVWEEIEGVEEEVVFD